MANFVVETFVPSGSHQRFETDVDGLRRAASIGGPSGRVLHLRSYLVPGDEMGFHLLEADSASAVAEVASRAGIDPERIVEASLDPGQGQPPFGQQ